MPALPGISRQGEILRSAQDDSRPFLRFEKTPDPNHVSSQLSSAPRHHHLVMRVLGENPCELDLLKKELEFAFGRGELLLAKPIDDLARLY